MTDWYERLGRPCKWIRIFQCSKCGGKHKVEGKRSILGALQNKYVCDGGSRAKSNCSHF